ncbi:hypothetical protein BDL97_09G092800 [Sphagnum fallax]|nr:hypothetical protein BDL97_09G092800 [Sphagnum fallax]
MKQLLSSLLLPGGQQQQQQRQQHLLLQSPHPPRPPGNRLPSATPKLWEKTKIRRCSFFSSGCYVVGNSSRRMGLTTKLQTKCFERSRGRQCVPKAQQHAEEFKEAGQHIIFKGEGEEEEDDEEVDKAAHRRSRPTTTRSLLCLSNGHGEDTIAASILMALLAVAEKSGILLKIHALPLVGEGHAYRQIQIPTVGPTKTMPSGGFIYMDIFQLLGDIKAGLLSLTVDQWGAIRQWADENPDGVFLAVGDVFPLVLAWLASKWQLQKTHQQGALSKARNPFYAFVGTAKSEFYIRGDDGSPLPSSWFSPELLLFGRSVYYPWERFLMSDPLCRLVVPRDHLTTKILKEHLPPAAWPKVQDLGNPMMDDLKPAGSLRFLWQYKPARFIALLPGSRAPEVFANWEQIMQSVEDVSTAFFPERLVFLAPIVPSLEPGPFMHSIRETNWQPHSLTLESYQPSDVAHQAVAGIAMAGTATEQLVGLGKPVFTLPGSGSQFTAAFAEAQSRLLGQSVFLCVNCEDLVKKMCDVLYDTRRLCEIAQSGQKRMGSAGAAHRISEQLLASLLS